jgi:hypothetical protein
MVKWNYGSTVLNLEISWRRIVSFTPQPPCPGEIAVCYHFLWGRVGPIPDLDAIQKNLLPLSEIERGFPYSSVRSLVTILAELTRP